MEQFCEKVFHLKENHTTMRTEIIAGITTFMTMAYILIVNPSILSATGMDKGALLTVTAIASALGTFFMAAFANYPFALGPGMGSMPTLPTQSASRWGTPGKWPCLPCWWKGLSSSSCP